MVYTPSQRQGVGCLSRVGHNSTAHNGCVGQHLSIPFTDVNYSCSANYYVYDMNINFGSDEQELLIFDVTVNIWGDDFGLVVGSPN